MLATIAGSSDQAFRLPDSILEESVPLVLENEYTVSSDAAGYAVFSEDPSLYLAKGSYTVTAGVTNAGTATSHPDMASYAAAFPYARMLMYRLIVEYVGAEQTASGRFYCINGIDSSCLASATLANIYDDANYTGKAIDGFYDTVLFTQQPRYELPTTTMFSRPTFQARSMFAAGLPPTTVCFRVRIQRFMEGLPGRDSLHRGATGIEFYDPSMMEVLTNASHPSLHGGAATKRTEIVANVWKGIQAGASLAWNNRAAIGQIGKFATSGLAKSALLGLMV